MNDQFLIESLFSVAQGGITPILWLLILLSILSIAIILERTIILRSALKSSQDFRDQLENSLKYNKLSKLDHLFLNSFEGQALEQALQYFKDGQDHGFDEIFKFYAIREKPKLERGLNFLATVGSNAPFIGLLGTVLGIMKAFKDLGVATATSGQMALVMNGIAEALVATAVGLFVAIPAVIAFNTFTKMVKMILTNMDAVRQIGIAYCKQEMQNMERNQPKNDDE